MNTAIIIVGHGSRSAEAVQNFDDIVTLVSEKNGTKVYGAHMELATPSIESVVADLWEKGNTNFKIIPYFLYNGNHIKHDIPEIMEKLKQKYSGLSYSISNPIGFEPLMADILLKKINS